MAHDPRLVEDTRAWLVRAGKDLRGVDIALSATPPFLEDVLFHAQQAAEKALKAFLTWHDVPFRKTHDLRELGRESAAIDASLQPVCEQAEELTPYAWQFRYPQEPGEPSLEDAARARILATAVYETILARLPEVARP
ncbi:MAG: HEPN domain-containing protein [Candidatus Tectomicrobia bacterium]|nr:HEPN domain-containing protein [Candidatus Tectomicrobia bacterium]